jgi:carbon-monoxide dehydrogenase medium subunit
VKPAPLIFERAKSIEQAIDLVAGHQGYAKFVAGGQTLGPMINLRLVQPDLVVDISRLPELRRLEQSGSHILVGAGTPHADFEDGVVPDPANGLLQKVASGIAYRAVRNRGTVGGSLAHADPAAEWPSVMTALGARLLIRGAAGQRSVDCDQFIHGAMTTSLADEEMIEAVEIPLFSPAMRWGFDKRSRKVGEFAHSLAVIVRDVDRRFCRAVLGASGGAPILLKRVTDLLATTSGWKGGFERELRTAYEDDINEAGVILDEYDQHVHGLAVIRAVKEALS